jgi:hypothetical protein
MSSDPQAQDVTADAGSATDQHVSGVEETGTFITDQEPTADTPAHGSSNEGVNALGANRVDVADDDATGPGATQG